MKAFLEFLPPIATDYTGVLNAFSGLKGCFVIMHSPHGCANYYTNDRRYFGEERHYAVVNAEIIEISVIMGGDERIRNSIREIDRSYAPQLIALVATPVSGIIGTDLSGIATEMQNEVSAKLAVFDKGGFEGDYTIGESDVFSYLASEIVKDSKNISKGVNIIGATPSRFNWRSDLREIKRMLDELDVPVVTCFTYEEELENISNAAKASLNLVVSESGIKAAKILEERFGLPSIIGVPMGFRGTREWLKQIGSQLDLDVGHIISEEMRKFGHLNDLIPRINWRRKFKAAVIGPFLYTKSLAKFLSEDLDFDVSLVTYTTAPDDNDSSSSDLEAGNILIKPQESKLVHRLKQTNPDILFGSPLYGKLLDDDVMLIPTAYPSLLSDVCDSTPYVGYQGAVLLKQVISNEIQMRGHKRIHTMSRAPKKDL